MRYLIPALCLLASPLSASPEIDRLAARTEAAFPRVPAVRQSADITEVCGGDVTARAVYCTTDNTIYLSEAEGPAAVYALAHLYGHGLQVRYGVADLALSAIRSEPEREAELRGMVTRQVECLAGFLIGRAGLTIPPLDLVFGDEPMTDAHWGRRPVRAGPEVSIGLAARAEWFEIGRGAPDASACTVGEMPADLIAEADRG